MAAPATAAHQLAIAACSGAARWAGRTVRFEDEGFDREVGVHVDLGEEADHFASDGFFDCS
jgi:hypothetical protein